MIKRDFNKIQPRDQKNGILLNREKREPTKDFGKLVKITAFPESKKIVGKIGTLTNWEEDPYQPNTLIVFEGQAIFSKECTYEVVQ